MTAEAEAFFGEDVLTIACFRMLESRLTARYPDMIIKVQKTQISFYDHGFFLCVSRPRRKSDRGIVVTFGLDAPVPDERISMMSEPRPNRWTHHVPVGSPEAVDDQLLAWIEWSHSFKRRSKRAAVK